MTKDRIMEIFKMSIEDSYVEIGNEIILSVSLLEKVFKGRLDHLSLLDDCNTDKESGVIK